MRSGAKTSSADTAPPATGSIGRTQQTPARKRICCGVSCFDLRLAILAMILAAVGTQWLLKHAPPPMERALLEAFHAALQPLPAATQARPAESGLSIYVRLSDRPDSIAASLPARPAGAVWQAFSSVADDEAARHWLEALRQRMPAETRPARFELIHEAGSEAGGLRIQPPPAEDKTR